MFSSSSRYSSFSIINQSRLRSSLNSAMTSGEKIGEASIFGW